MLTDYYSFPGMVLIVLYTVFSLDSFESNGLELLFPLYSLKN